MRIFSYPCHHLNQPIRPRHSLAQREPTDLENTDTLELDVRHILLDSKKNLAPTGKVTLTKAATKWNLDDEWLVFDVKGLVDGEGNTMTATATTMADGESIHPEFLDVRLLFRLRLLALTLT